MSEERTRHECHAPPLRKDHSMEAVTECIEYEPGYFVVGNGEYDSPVNFCPFCGMKSPHPIPVDESPAPSRA